jgi:hypothetical protein
MYDPASVKSFEPPIRIIIHSIMLLIFYVMNTEKIIRCLKLLLRYKSRDTY